MENSSPLKLAKLLLVFVLVLLCVVVAWYLIAPQSYQAMLSSIEGEFSIVPSSPATSAPSPAVLSLSQQAEQGDVVGASIGAQNLDGVGATPADAFGAALIQDTASALTATTSQARLSNMQSLLADYNRALSSSTPFYQAWTLNAIVRALSRGDSTLLPSIAQDSALSSYVAAGDINTTMSNLAQYSYSIYPTSVAAYLSAENAQTYILQHYYVTPESSQIKAGLSASKATIVEWLGKGDDALAIESAADTSQDVLGVGELPQDYLLRASLLSVLSLVDSSYWTQAQAAYQSIYDYYTKTLDSQGNPYPILLQPVASAHLLESLYLYWLNANGNAAAIKTNLQQFVVAYNANPSIEQSLVASINSLQLVAQGKNAVVSVYGTQAWASMQNAYAMYLYFAKISPDFKSFLVSQGWNLSQ
jgi:hypothetical protein